MLRYAPSIAKYEMLQHDKEEPSEKRFATIQKGRYTVMEDGLSNVEYSVISHVQRDLYTHVLVTI